MKLIDTHCHLYLEEFDSDHEALIHEAIHSNIAALLLPNVDTTTVDRLISFGKQYSGYVFPMMGLHPTSVNKDYASQLRTIETYLSATDYCAIGEIGIDLYWDKTYLKEQKLVFEEQLKWSMHLNLPVSIHTREAFPEVLDCIYKVGAEKLSGVFHSFSGTEEDLQDILRLDNFKLGINGVITFKNAKLSEVIRNVAIQDIVLETDAPYLAPVPYRGKRNEPIYIWNTAKKVAEVFDLTEEKVAEVTTQNALELFRNINKTVML